jgi:hypothetical protein
MTADALLSKLDKVKRTGAGRWLACCPSHQDRTASLSIRELDDGRTLVHCFAGCSVHEIVAAAGIELSDLFPPRDDSAQFKKGERRPFPAADILRAIAGESRFVYLCARTTHAGENLADTDLARLLLAASRIQAALGAGGIHDC